MGPRSKSLSIASALFVFSVLWNPAYTNDQCLIECKGAAAGPTFLDNHKYNYAVEGVVSVFLTGADKQETSVKLNAQVSVAAQGNCGYILRVQSVQISGGDGKKYSKPPGIDKPVRFSLQDGKVGSEICTETDDTRRSLNIKRAIISLLQTPLKQSTETDVFGVCPTAVSSSEEGGAILVHRYRDLSRCGLREQGRNDLVTGILDSDSEIKTTQVLQSILNIESKVKSGVPEKISATEEYLYKPFSVGQNGARAKVHTKVTLTGQAAGTDNGKFTEVRTIIFENPHGVKVEESNLQNAVLALKDTAKSLEHEASSTSAGEFVQLVRILRLTSKDDLVKLYNQIKGNNLNKRIFLDALLRAGTGASVETSIQLLKNKELSDLEQKLVFLSLGNAKHVTNEALKAAASLLDLPNIPKEVYLGVGALAGAYCNSHRCHGTGSQSEGIAVLSQKLAAKLQNCKPKTKVDEDYVVAALKGIRSIRHIEDSLTDRLVHCVADVAVKARVKVAALEAIHADPCSEKLNKVAIEVMKNRLLDSEIRIKGYLAVIECPSGKSANEIKKLLDDEPVRQVGRFISSSLRHIRTSANPDKQLAKQHYGLIKTPYKYEVDDRKYSFYREASLDVDSLGIGGSLEHSVIFSQDSFLPRSASINVTAELFGHSLNILEIGGRQGNLDRVAEHFLGPKGLINTASLSAIIEKLQKVYQDAEGKIRTKRSVQQDIANFDKQLKDETAPFNNEIDLDIYVKLFGTDAVFLSLGDGTGFDLDDIVNPIVKSLASGIDTVKNFQKEVRAHLLFLDAELAYPTSTGFALKLDLIGAATGRLEVSSSIDIKRILKDPSNAKIDIKLIPSTDIEISGLLLVDAESVATGLKVVLNLHSSTGGHLVSKLDGSSIDLHFGLPIDRQEILTAKNDLVFVTRERGHKDKEVALKIDSPKKDLSVCFDQLSNILGLTLCTELLMPFSIQGSDAGDSIQKFIARYPLTGPAMVKVYFDKHDLRGLRLKAALHQDPAKRGFDLLFEAEGGKNRKTTISGDLINKADEQSIILSLDSPVYVAYGQASLINKKNEKVILVKAKLNADEYFGKVGVTGEGNDKRSVYKPVIEYQLPGPDGKRSLKIEGKLIQEVDQNSLKLSLEGVKVSLPNSDEVIGVNGYILRDSNIVIELNANKGDYSGSLKGSQVGEVRSLEFKNTLNPNINFKLDTKSDNLRPNHYQNDIELYYGGDLKTETQRVSLNQLLKYQKGQQYSVLTKNKLSIPLLPILVKVNADVDNNKVEIDLEGQYMDYKVDLEAKGRKNIKKPGDYNIKIEALALDKGIEILSKRDIVDDNKSNFENYISIKNIGKYELSGVVLHKVNPNDINVGATGHLKLRTGKQQQDVKFDFGLQQNPKLVSSHLKVSTNRELINYLIKVNLGANPNGELVLVLLDEFSAKGQFKVNDNDGKGNGGLVVHFKKADKKIKGDVTFLAKAPVFNAELDLFLNSGKDESDKIHLSTKNKISEFSIDTKNQLVYAGKKSEVNVKAAVSKDNNLNVESEVVLPTERIINLKFIKNQKQDGDKQVGSVEVQLGDKPKRNEKGSQIVYKANSDLSKSVYSYTGIIKIELKDGRNLDQKFNYHAQQVTEKGVKVDLGHEITGSMIPAPYSASSNVEIYDTDKGPISGSVKYLLKASYGDKIRLNFEGNNEITETENGVTKVVADNVIAVSIPVEQIRDARLVSNILFLVPASHGGLDYTISQLLQLKGEQYKFDANGKVSTSEGHSKVKLLLPKSEPMTLEQNYKYSADGGKTKAELEVKSTYGKGESQHVQVLGSAGGNREYSLVVKANAPKAEKKKLEVTLNAKNPNPDTYNLDFVADLDGDVLKSDALLVYSRQNPLVDLKVKYPKSEKTSRIYLKGTVLEQNHGKLEAKLENLNDVSFDGIVEALVKKDNLLVTLQGNSEKLGLKNYKIKISSKGAGSGKKLEIQSENNNKNLYSGSTSYIQKQEGPKMIIEGSGSIKVNDQQKSANFKYIRTVLTEGNEQGVETFMNVAVGDRSHVVEIRLTNLESKTSYVYCEETKQCAQAEFNSKISVQAPYQHVLNVILDLRKLGINPEFGLQMTNEIVGQSRLQSALIVHLNKDDLNYHLHAFNKPRPGSHMGYESAIILELPKRIMGVEAYFSAGTRNLAFPFKAEMAMYLDKNKPQQRVSAKLDMDLTGNAKQHTFKTDFKIHHPKIPQDTGISVTGNIRHESFTNFMIEGAASVTNEGQAKVLLDVKPNQVKVIVDTPLVKLIEAEGSVNVNDKAQEAEIKFSLLQGKPVLLKAVAKENKYFEFTSGYTDDPQRKLSIIGHVDIDKRIDISADVVLSGSKKNIANGALFLKDNALKTDYGASKQNFEYFVNALKGDLNNLKDRVSQLGNKAQKDMSAKLEKYKVNLNKVEDDLKQELEKIKHEIVNDKTLQDIDKALNGLVRFVAGILNEVIHVTTTFADIINKQVTETYTKVNEIYNKQIAPLITKLYENIAAAVKEFMDPIIDIVAHFGAIVNDFIEKHRPELNELNEAIAGIFKALTRILVEKIKEYRAVVSSVYSEFIQHINEMPVITMLKEKIEELLVPERLAEIVNDVYQAIQVVLPTEDSKQLAEAVVKYLQKKIKKEKFNEEAELRVITEKLVATFSSFLNIIKLQLGQFNVPNLLDFNTLSSLSGPSPGLPAFGGTTSASFINELLTGDIPDPLAYIKAYRPRSLNPLSEVPAKLRAVVVNGQHIFTFDGSHLTFPGNCRYILTHDYVDGNFTLAMQLQKGQLKALVLKDKSNTVIEIKDNGHVSLNGANHPFPVIQEDTLALKEVTGIVALQSKYGILVKCNPKLTVCYVEVSGFYHGKLRGLLGDGNNEPNDDFRLPNRKIVSDPAGFGNAYRLSSSCPQVKSPEHSAHQLHASLPPACEEVFGSLSTLRAVYWLLDVTPFRQACIHAVAANPSKGKEEACDLARGYTALANTGLLLTLLPPVCLKCTDTEKPQELGDEYKIVLSGKQADVVVLVETTKGNADVYKKLVVPLIGQVVESLKQKHVSDIKVHVIGISPKFSQPIIYDSDVKLKGANIEFNDLTRTPNFLQSDLELDQLQTALKIINDGLRLLGLTNVAAAYNRVLEVPLRPGAIKTIVSVVSEPCAKNFLLVELARIGVIGTVLELKGITHSIITVTPGLAQGDKPASKVVGYTSDSVIMLGDKKSGKNTEKLRSELTTHPDTCADFIQQTQGIVFSVDNFLSAGGEQGQFIQTAAAAIVDQLIEKKELKQTCICTYVNPFSVQTVCYIDS